MADAFSSITLQIYHMQPSFKKIYHMQAVIQQITICLMPLIPSWTMLQNMFRLGRCIS